ncbi:MAG: Ribonucleotide reductase of class III (anaerobic), activating protein [Brockia lithotrophica]|uniref:Ribonucleotide reductase of class III (Anaerobic), activating protein n=1 Tax=Brockia lithotrophica TaxID=933949 RepID=A0A2T5G8C5_9BACL|nr:MAG: Ribonucleotide reductase of class III (anaerobic), activating protein [Brockia lithotrophica]
MNLSEGRGPGTACGLFVFAFFCRKKKNAPFEGAKGGTRGMFYDFIPLTLVDYPGHVAATAFISGCNFRCPYCHNSELIRVQPKPRKTEDEFLAYLTSRKDVLEGVCITGGEPTLWKGLPDLLRRIKDLGLKVKLDSQGSRPRVLEMLFREGLVDYIAMDVKAPREKYGEYVRDLRDVDRVAESVELVKTLAPDYEFRTTVVEKLHTVEDVVEIARQIAPCRRYVLQAYRPSSGVKDVETSGDRPTPASLLEEIRRRLPAGIGEVVLRTYA